MGRARAGSDPGGRDRQIPGGYVQLRLRPRTSSCCSTADRACPATTCARRIPSWPTTASASSPSTSSAPASRTGRPMNRCGASRATSRRWRRSAPRSTSARCICSAIPGAAGWRSNMRVHHGDKLKTLLLEDTVADMPHLISELERLRVRARLRDRRDDAAARGARHHQPSGIHGGDHPAELPPCLPADGTGRRRSSVRSTTGTWART